MDSSPHRPHPPIADAMGPPLSPAGRGMTPLDHVADFPAIPEGWSYLDTAATAQKPSAVIEADDSYFNALSLRWAVLLHEATGQIPNPPWMEG